MAHNLNSLSELPFHDWNLDEYLKETGTWVIHPLFDKRFQYASSRHTYKTRYASKQNLCKPPPRTNMGKEMFSYQATDLWSDIPHHVKDLTAVSFSKEIKRYLLSEQHSTRNQPEQKFYLFLLTIT